MISKYLLLCTILFFERSISVRLKLDFIASVNILKEASDNRFPLKLSFINVLLHFKTSEIILSQLLAKRLKDISNEVKFLLNLSSVNNNAPPDPKALDEMFRWVSVWLNLITSESNLAPAGCKFKLEMSSWEMEEFIFIAPNIRLWATLPKIFPEILKSVIEVLDFNNKANSLTDLWLSKLQTIPREIVNTLTDVLDWSALKSEIALSWEKIFH